MSINRPLALALVSLGLSACNGLWRGQDYCPDAKRAADLDVRQPKSSCLSGDSCVDNSDCPSGSHCNLALSPPACETLYCGGEYTACSEDPLCERGMRCYDGRCNPCDLCGSLCAVDFNTDPENCGCCDQTVPIGGECVDGIAVCVEGRSLCGDVCVDLTRDPNNCGACDDVVPSGADCVNGQPGCEHPQETLCSDGCKELDYDDDNCGTCGAPCTAGYCWGSGQCSVSCDERITGEELCGQTGMDCAECWTTLRGWCDAVSYGISCSATPPESVSCSTCTCEFDTLHCACVP